MLVHPLLKIQDLKVSAIAEYDKEFWPGQNTTIWAEVKGHRYKAAMLPWDWMEGREPNFLIVEACTGGYRVVPQEEMEQVVKASEQFLNACQSLPSIHPEYNVKQTQQRLYASAVGHTKERKKVFNVPLEKLKQQYIDGYYVRPWGNNCVFFGPPRRANIQRRLL